MLAACPAFENYLTLNPLLLIPVYLITINVLNKLKHQIALGKCGHLGKILSMILFCKS